MGSSLYEGGNMSSAQSEDRAKKTLMTVHIYQAEGSGKIEATVDGGGCLGPRILETLATGLRAMIKTISLLDHEMGLNGELIRAVQSLSTSNEFDLGDVKFIRQKPKGEDGAEKL